jgi:hypothetical protein
MVSISFRDDHEGGRAVSREQLLVRTLLELADTMVADYDVLDVLYLLCDRVVELVDADAAGVLLMAPGGGLEVAAATSHDMRQLEGVEAAHQQGPCAEAHRTGEVVDEGDLREQRERWPQFGEAALALGFRSVHARPLRLRGESIGALNVFRRRVGRFSSDDADVLAGLADMATVGIVSQRALDAAEGQVLHLQQALSRRAVVDQATAVLADRLGTDQGDAFQRLRGHARDHNERLRDLAHRFLAGEIGVRELEGS